MSTRSETSKPRCWRESVGVGVDIVLLRQPRGSYSCGQHCVAMVTGGDLARVLKVFGHEWRTGWRDIVKACRTLGVNVMPYPASLTGANLKPAQCFVRVKSKTDPGWSHFCIFSHGVWWDSCLGTGEGRKRHPLWEPHMYQASYLEIMGYDRAVYRLPEVKHIATVKPILAGEWDKLPHAGKAQFVEKVFAIAGAVDSLAQAWKLGKQMAGEGYAFEWIPFDAAWYCDMTRGDEKHIGYGRTLSEALCAASLAATGFLLQRTRRTDNFLTDESKAKAQAKSHQNLQ